ncbi:hypothetical protein Tco_0967655 [Tanacetum coccineum]
MQIQQNNAEGCFHNNSLKQLKIINSEGLEKGYDRFQQLLSQLEAHGAKVSTEDANHKFLRSLPPAWSNLAMTMRTNPEIDTLSIDDLYNNLRVFEQEIQGASKTSSSAQNVAFVSQSKSITNKVKFGFTGAYSSCILLTLQPCSEKEFLCFYKENGEGEFSWMEKHLLDLTKRSLDASIVTTLVTLLGNVQQRGHMMERRKETHFINIKKLEAREESDGFAD